MEERKYAPKTGEIFFRRPSRSALSYFISKLWAWLTESHLPPDRFCTSRSGGSRYLARRSATFDRENKEGSGRDRMKSRIDGQRPNGKNHRLNLNDPYGCITGVRGRAHGFLCASVNLKDFPPPWAPPQFASRMSFGPQDRTCGCGVGRMCCCPWGCCGSR